MRDTATALHQLTEALKALSPTADGGPFACCRTLPADRLALSVDGVGKLRWPISLSQGRQLCRVATPAPVGLGRETRVDPDVRDVGEIKRRHLQFDRRAWSRALAPTLETMREALGLPEGRLRARPDKLLVYDTGQFFKPHKDTERADDMVGTLVVVLPSAHKGGSLLVRHRGVSRRFLVRQAAEGVLSLFAFYASCEHEVRPVTEGQRVVLSHSLHFTPSASSSVRVHAEPLKRAIAAFFEAASTPAQGHRARPEKLAYLLDHEYSRRSLAWRHLKGADHRRAVSIAAASQALGLQTHLALVKLSEVWSAYVEQPSYYQPRRARSRSFDPSVDGDEDDAPRTAHRDLRLLASTRYKVEKLIARHASLDHWRNGQDEAVKLAVLDASEEELCWLIDLDAHEPKFEEFKGYMGNYGNTLQREYHRAAIVLWPRRDHYRILAGSADPKGGAAAIDALVRDVGKLDESAVKDALLSLLEVWPGNFRSEDPTVLRESISLAQNLSDDDTLIELLISVSIAALTPPRMSRLLSLGKRRGRVFCQRLFDAWMGGESARTSTAREAHVQAGLSADELTPIGRRFKRHPDPLRLDWLSHFPTFCRRVREHESHSLRPIPASLFEPLRDLVFATHAGHHRNRAPSENRRHIVREIEELSKLIDAAFELGDSYRTIDLLDDIERRLNDYASEVAVAVIEHLVNHDVATRLLARRRQLAQTARAVVQARIDKSTRDADDWRIDATPDCGCRDCATLLTFLKSTERAIDLPLAKARRRHLQGTIDSLELPVTYSTRRQGSPYVLELRKQSRLFTDAEAEVAHQRAQAAELEKLVG